MDLLYTYLNAAFYFFFTFFVYVLFYLLLFLTWHLVSFHVLFCVSVLFNWSTSCLVSFVLRSLSCTFVFFGLSFLCFYVRYVFFFSFSLSDFITICLGFRFLFLVLVYCLFVLIPFIGYNKWLMQSWYPDQKLSLSGVGLPSSGCYTE